MIVWNTVPNEEKISLWKNLREEVTGLDLEKQLQTIAKFCFNIPIGSRTVDYYTPNSWPTPWEILYHSSFCKSSISILIYYTITLVCSDAQTEMHLIDDEGDIYLLPIVNNYYVLNYHLGELNKLEDVMKEVKIIRVYTTEMLNKIS